MRWWMRSMSLTSPRAECSSKPTHASHPHDIKRRAEMTFDSIITLITLLIGGGGIGSILTWRYSRSKAQVEVDKEKQDYYQQLIDDLAKDREDRKRQNDELRAERDHYKNGRNELRDELEKLREEVRKLHDDRQKEREESQAKLMECDSKIARLSRKVDAMRPFLCTDLSCKKRNIVTIFDEEEKIDVEG